MSSHWSSLSGSLLSAVCDSSDKAGTQKEKKWREHKSMWVHCTWFGSDESEVHCRDNHLKGNGFAGGSHKPLISTFFPPHWFFSVLLFACILVTTDCMRQNTQVVQLFQDDTCCHRKVYDIYQHCLESVEEIRNRKWAVTGGEPDQYLQFCVRRSSKSAATALQHDLQQAHRASFSWGYKDPILFNGSVHRICQRTPELARPP